MRFGDHFRGLMAISICQSLRFQIDCELIEFAGEAERRLVISQALTPGKHTIVFDFKYDGPGLGKGGTGVMSVDGKEVSRKTIPHTVPSLFTIDEFFDVGVDTRTSVDDKDYQPPFRFTGKLDKLTINLEPRRMADVDRQKAAEMVAKAHDDQ